uniref:WD repeat-containing protein 60 n=1 Tax=Acrobeloides nanus TaxID=290746 RepID=A0A914CCE1_9BILA
MSEKRASSKSRIPTKESRTTSENRSRSKSRTKEKTKKGSEKEEKPRKSLENGSSKPSRSDKENKPRDNKEKDGKKDKKHKESSHKSRSKDKNDGEAKSTGETKAPLIEEPIVDEYEYEDDFEEYEEDFEEESENESNEVATKSVPKIEEPVNKNIESAVNGEALEEESTLLKRLNSRRDPTPQIAIQHTNEQAKIRDKPQRVTSATRKFNFENAREINLSDYSEAMNKFSRLKQLIGLEITHQQIADIPPIRDYEFYIQLFGKGNRTQTSTQTGEDNLNSECQTEIPENETVWTQFPATDHLGWGREVSNKNTFTGDFDDQPGTSSTALTLTAQSMRLAKFVDVAGQLITDLISAEMIEGQQFHLQNKSKLAFSTGYNTISLTNLFKDYRANNVIVKPTKTSHILIAYFTIDSNLPSLEKKSILLEFNLNSPTAPTFVFICENEVSSICYGVEGSNSIFAGLKDGSCVAWDTRESEYQHTGRRLPWPDIKEPLCARLPSYDTSFCSIDKSIQKYADSAIIAVKAVGSDQAESIYQLVNLNESGIITVWMVIENLENFEFDLDLGMRPDAKMKLNKINTIDCNVAATSFHTLVANNMAVNPKNLYQLIIAASNGLILNINRVRTAFNGPRQYITGVTAEVLCVKFSPFDEKVFVAGLSNGYILIYREDQYQPVVTLIPPNSSRLAVTHIEWSANTAHLLYSVHNGDRILVWDLATGKSPIHICDLQTEISSKVLSTDSWKDDRGVGFMALGLSNGEVVIHSLERIVAKKEDNLFEIIELLEQRF